MSSKDLKQTKPANSDDELRRQADEQGKKMAEEFVARQEEARKARIAILTKNGFSEEDAAGFVK